MSGEALLAEARAFFSGLAPEPVHFAVRLAWAPAGVEVEVATDEVSLERTCLHTHTHSLTHTHTHTHARTRTRARTHPAILQPAASLLRAM